MGRRSTRRVTKRKDTGYYEVKSISDAYYDHIDNCFYFKTFWKKHDDPDWIPLKDVIHLDAYEEFVCHKKHCNWKLKDVIEYQACPHCPQWSPGIVTKLFKPTDETCGYLSIECKVGKEMNKYHHIPFGSSRIRRSKHLQSPPPCPSKKKAATGKKDRAKSSSTHRKTKLKKEPNTINTKKHGKVKKSKNQQKNIRKKADAVSYREYRPAGLTVHDDKHDILENAGVDWKAVFEKYNETRKKAVTLKYAKRKTLIQALCVVLMDEFCAECHIDGVQVLCFGKCGKWLHRHCGCCDDKGNRMCSDCT